MASFSFVETMPFEKMVDAWALHTTQYTCIVTSPLIVNLMVTKSIA